MNMEEERMNKKKKSLATLPPFQSTSFSSLPYDLALNCLARISIFHRPTLSLVSKTFRSLIASPDLNAARTRIGKTEKLLYFCLDLYINPKPSWFILSPLPNQKFIPVPLFSLQQHPKSASFTSVGSEIYMIGGLVNRKRSKRVFVLNCPSHQWSIVPEMNVPRESAGVEVIDGKIYVIGGCEAINSENWGEVYDLKTKIWEPLPPKTTLEGGLVLGGKVCAMHGSTIVLGGEEFYVHGLNLKVLRNICYVEIDNVVCQIMGSHSALKWYDPKEKMMWSKIKGLEELERVFPTLAFNKYYLTSNTVSGGGRRLTVWWLLPIRRLDDNFTTKWETEIWCAEVSLERRSSTELWGFVEWSKKVYNFDGTNFSYAFILHSTLMTH